MCLAKTSFPDKMKPHIPLDLARNLCLFIFSFIFWNSVLKCYCRVFAYRITFYVLVWITGHQLFHEADIQYKVFLSYLNAAVCY